MRYEHLTLDLSTATCNEILRLLTRDRSDDEWAPSDSAELINFCNELRARLQRTDQDPNVMLCPVCRKPEAGRDHLNVCYVDSNLDLTS